MRKGRCVKWSKGRTRCMRRAKPLSGGLGRTRKRRCPKGIVKSGPRKGLCRKTRRPRRR